MFVETRERYEKRHNLIVSLPEGDVVRPPREFEKIVVKAAEWIDDNPPPHVTDSNGLQYGMSMGAQRFCSFGSSFVHGYKWMRDYVAGKRDILAQISDRPAAALGVIDGISDALVGVVKLVGGPLADDPNKRGRTASGGYLGTYPPSVISDALCCRVRLSRHA